MPGPVRGVSGHQEVADAAAKNRGGGWTKVLMLKDGDKVMTRFRGFTRQLPSMTKETLSQMTAGELREICLQWQVYDVVEGGSDPAGALVERLIDRQGHLEPCTVTEDYIHNNQAGRHYVTCAQLWDGSPCVTCRMREQGDKRISQKVSANFSVVPLRFYHYVKNEADPKKSDFAYCTRVGYNATGRCSYCARRIEAKQEGMKRLSLASMHAGGVFACAERIAKRCAACEGLGHIQHACWSCSGCGEPFDSLADYSETGVIAPKARHVRCRECGTEGFPIEEVTCSKRCATARRGQLFDTDVLIERIGSNKKTTYSFTEQYPFTPASADVLKFRVPQWEVVMKPASVERQCHDVGVRVNPFTGASVGPQGPADDQSVSYEQTDADQQYDADIPF